jgi:ATP-dependent protease Clp ATPase subunit
METILTDIMYEAPNFRNKRKVNKVNITSDFVRNIINQKYPTKNVA